MHRLRCITEKMYSVAFLLRLVLAKEINFVWFCCKQSEPSFVNNVYVSKTMDGSKERSEFQ